MTDPYPKIELHVHLEGTVRPATLIEIARRNDYRLPATTIEELIRFYRFTDFRQFVQVWILTTNALQTQDDFRQVVVDYAAEARTHGAVYIEAIFSPAERVRRGCHWQSIYEGICDGIQQAHEEHHVHVRAAPDITRGFSHAEALQTVTWAARYRERGIVAIGLGGLETDFPAKPYKEVFKLARSHGLGSVPHAGETVGPQSIKEVLDNLAPDRIRHGIRATEDLALLDELAARGIVLDVCPISNLRTAAIPDLATHPLPQLLAHGIPCSISTDDPAMFQTDLTQDHTAAISLGATPSSMCRAGLTGALCEPHILNELHTIFHNHDWHETDQTNSARRDAPHTEA